MKKITYSQILAIVSFITLILLGFFSIKLPFRGDEKHIVETIRLFANNFHFETIKDYPEVTPPFFYIFYAIWAKIFGQSIESLRIITMILAFITWQLIFHLNRLFIKNELYAFLIAILIIINPYFLGASIFVFTDMLTIMLCVAAVISFLKNKLFLFTIFSMLAILCRQYAIVIPIGVIVYNVFNYLVHKSKNTNMVIGSLVSFIPLLIVFIFWGGISPASGINKWIIPNSDFYNFDYINAYITFSAVYLFPLILLFYKKIKVSPLSMLITSVIAFILSRFPIKASAATLEFTEYKSVGFVHQFLIQIFGFESYGLKIILFLLLFIGVYLNVEMLKHFFIQIKEKKLSKDKIFLILWILFLVVIPFSYQVWEKYLIMILPFYAIILFLFISSKLNGSQSEL